MQIWTTDEKIGAVSLIEKSEYFRNLLRADPSVLILLGPVKSKG
jgi:hypothetical protein